VYVGSTTVALTRRFALHRHRASSSRPSPFHKYVNENGGWDAYTMSIVEDCSKGNDIDTLLLRQRERYWWDTLKPICNSMRPYKTPEEYDTYYETNKERIIENSMKTYWRNKESGQRSQ